MPLRMLRRKNGNVFADVYVLPKHTDRAPVLNARGSYNEKRMKMHIPQGRAYTKNVRDNCAQV
jgi:hypothetical protein